MMEFAFEKSHNLLLLGEGNFSFCRDLIFLMKTTLSITDSGKFTNVYASCFEDEGDCSIDDDVKRFLLSEGVNLVYGLDATRLEQHGLVAKKKFRKIIFNFPHIRGKMRMDLNRTLLTNFFSSAASFLDSDGSVVVSLCEGQGGTPVDKPRRYDDTWKIVECGASAGFVLTRTSPWPVSMLSNYRPSGFRGGEKSFRTEGAIVHTFEIVEPLNTHSVPEDLMGFHEVSCCDALRVPLAHKRMLRHSTSSWEVSVQRHVERRIQELLPKEFTNLGELPWTTPNRLQNSQVECIFQDKRAFLRSSFEQIIDNKIWCGTGPCYGSGIMFRRTDHNFSSFPGSYQIVLIAGCDELSEVIEGICDGLGISLDPTWCNNLRENVRVLNVDALCLQIFKTSLFSSKSLWISRTRVVAEENTSIVGVSLFPPKYSFDLSFSSNGPLSDAPFLDLMHNLADDLVDSVVLQSRYSPEGSYAVYHCFRITYQSYDKPLHRASVIAYQHYAVRQACEKYLDVAVR